MQCGYNSNEIYYLFKKYSKKIKYVDWINILKLIYGILVKKKIIIDGLNSGKKIEKLINEEANKKNIKKISDIKIPLIIPSVDLYSGNIYCFVSKIKRKEISNNIIYEDDIEIGKAVRASCSYPVVFSPCNYNNVDLIDGGIKENIPWKQAKYMGAEKVISVVFEKSIEEKSSDNMIDIINNSITLLNEELSNYEMNGSDYIIKIKTGKIGLLDMSKMDELYKLGYDTAKNKLNEFNI